MHSRELSRLVANKTEDSKSIKHSKYGDGDVCNRKLNFNIDINAKT